MYSRTFATLLVALTTFAGLAPPLIAQGVPTPAQAQQMVKDDPGVVGRLQRMLQSSGLTPEQVRARLKEAGYPDSLLDAYMPGAATPDSTQVPSNDVFAAIRTIGLTDSLSADSLGMTARRKRRMQ